MWTIKARQFDGELLELRGLPAELFADMWSAYRWLENNSHSILSD